MDGSLFAGIFMILILAMFVVGTPIYIIAVHIRGWSTGDLAGLSWQAFVFACSWLAVIIVATVAISIGVKRKTHDK